MDMSTLRRLVRMILESKEDKDKDDDKKKSHLILEPDSSKKRKPRSKSQEASTVAGSMTTSSGMLAEPDGSGIDSGDGCEDVGDCKKDNEKEEKRMKKPIKREASVAASAGGGPAMPLGVGPHYPGPDSPAVKRIRKQIDVVGRAYGGAKTTKKKSH